jgi:hypothetical protein
MKTVEHVAAAVEETNEWKTEWAEPILSIILEFDAALRRLNPPPPPMIIRRRATAKENRDMGGEEDWEPAPKKARKQVLAEVEDNVRCSRRLAMKG